MLLQSAHPVFANSGAPMSRRHREHLTSSLLGPRDPFVKIPLVLRVGIWFGVQTDPRRFVEGLLIEAGYDSPEDLRDHYDHPPRRLMARPAPGHFTPKDIRFERPEIILREALILGLSTQAIYDPNRPVTWTAASLTRYLELYDPTSFYQ